MQLSDPDAGYSIRWLGRLNMVRGSYTGCDRKMKSWNPDRFHRLPLSKPAILREWLIASEVDETDIKTRRDRDYRVCRQQI